MLELLVIIGFSLEILFVQRPFGLRSAGGDQEDAGGQQDGTENAVSCHEIHPIQGRA
jgi:hypothetical protein